MTESAFTAGKIAVTERNANGTFTVRLMIPPRKGWRQSGMSQRFDTRTESQLYVAKLAIEHDAAVLNDHETAISPSWGEW